MSNIEGTSGTNLPGVFTSVETQSRGASVPGGTRIAAIIGEGLTREVIVAAATGAGSDGLNASYTSTTGADGRHFLLSQSPLISNRTKLYKNGSLLVGTEGTITSSTTTFSNKYDYMLDITNGRILMQKAALVDQGGSYYVSGSTNVGVGKINSLTLEDDNAPTENWSIKCVSVQRNALNQPIANTAKFIAIGSVSGNLVDANGNPVVWTANNIASSNGILNFSIQETDSIPFREGDSFLIKIKSGLLNRNDSLTSSYIPSVNINDPTFLQSVEDISKKHGLASTSETLALGCQLAFANSAPGIMCVQAAPAMPRRTSYTLVDSMNALSINEDDFIFPLPPGVTPDPDANIHFFVTDNTTNVERQLLPNKLDYYTLGTSGKPTQNQFIFSDTAAPSGYSFFYTVIETNESMVAGLDGYMALNTAVGHTYGIFSAVSAQFNSTHVGKTLKVIDATNVANNGSFVIDSVSGGKLYVHTTGFSDFTNESSVDFQVIHPSTGVAVASGTGTDGVLTAVLSTATASLVSASINFGSIPSILQMKLKITGSTNNNGLYDILTNPSSNTITIRKTFTYESGLRYEVIDTSSTSKYIVVNHNVVPDGNALRVSIVDSKDASFYDAGWINALASLEASEVDIIVPLPKQTISAIFQNTLNHCKIMSNIKNRRERVLFCGAISGLTPDHVIGAKSAAVEDIGVLEGIQGDTVSEVLAGNIEDLANYSISDAFGNTYRAVYFYPDQIVVQVGADNVLLDGFYMAAAAAGYLSATSNIAMPLTRKVLSGFTILRNKQFSPTTLEKLVAAGACVLQPVQGGGQVVWGITTSQSGFVEEQEISIVFIRDRIAKTLRTGFDAFIGMPQDNSMLAKITARAVALINGFIGQGLITDYKDLTVQQDTVDPTQVNVSVRVQPVYALNFIFIKVSVGLL